jgi:hypothetical protein
MEKRAVKVKGKKFFVDELKCCPFCGNDATLAVSSTEEPTSPVYVNAMCVECAANICGSDFNGNGKRIVDSIVKKWNKRNDKSRVVQMEVYNKLWDVYCDLKEEMEKIQEKGKGYQRFYEEMRDQVLNFKMDANEPGE